MKPDSADNPMQFKIVHLMYISAMLASALATFGLSGTIPGLIICFFWVPIFLSNNRPKTLLNMTIPYLLLCCLILSVYLPMSIFTLEDARRMQCQNNLKQLGLALHNYHDTYDTLPPAYIADENGKPIHSWRVLILPFMGEQALYDKYDFNEPWDGPNNKILLKHMPDVYACPSNNHSLHNHEYCSSYVAVAGPSSIWNGDATTKFADVADGLSNTLLLTECDELQIPWMKPDDVQYYDALNMFTSADIDTFEGHQSETFFLAYNRKRYLLFADGSVSFCYVGTTQDTWTALIGIKDEIEWSYTDLLGDLEKIKRLKIGNHVRLGFFLFLMVFPLPWVWINPTPRLKTKEPFA